MDVRHNNNALKELNEAYYIDDQILLHLGLYYIYDQMFRTLLHLGQLLHLGLQHACL